MDAIPADIQCRKIGLGAQGLPRSSEGKIGRLSSARSDVNSKHIWRQIAESTLATH
jgi:hypothetical protein